MNMNEMKAGTIAMAEAICQMVDLIEKGFMEHRTEHLAAAMKKEGEVNEKEKALAAAMLELSKSEKDAGMRKELVSWAQAVEMLERMGDEIASLAERVEIKIAENLLFSDIGVEQFNEVYGFTRKSVNMMRDFLKEKNSEMRERIIDNGFHVKSLVERYRREHTDRLLKGLCTPMAANMYFDILDFTGNLARHSSSIVKLF